MCLPKQKYETANGSGYTLPRENISKMVGLWRRAMKHEAVVGKNML